MKALIAIDGSKTSERAVRHVIELSKGREAIEVHLINVQDTADAPQLKRFLKGGDITRMQREHGVSTLATAARLLDRAGIEHKTHVLIGNPAQSIARFAKRGRFSQIIMGAHGRGMVAGLLMGSVATKVLHFADIPVTLVK
ncbi:MAG: universal stress protein [Pseudomonadota bacterium]